MSKSNLFSIALLWSCFLASCSSYDTFDEMAQAMCAGRVPDVAWSEVPTDAVIVDVRSEAEWKISHLKQAVNLEWSGTKLTNLPMLNKDTPILVYCSVGYRSEQAGEYLLQKGYTHVYNLYGGLFKVYNENQVDLISHNNTAQIHGYNQRWGKWITRGGVCYE
jgi:rhodanese-related sulfurtransferase